jgi:hypothetical protein
MKFALSKRFERFSMFLMHTTLAQIFARKKLLPLKLRNFFDKNHGNERREIIP